MENGIALASQEARNRLSENLSAVNARILTSCERAGRPAGSVDLLPVVKSVGPEVVKLLHDIGIRDVAEGTVQLAVAKRDALAGLGDLRWHLVGHLQRNKARRAARIFRSLHSLDSIRLAEKLEEDLALIEEEAGGGEEDRPLPRIFLEVNISGESAKGGITAEGTRSFLEDLRRSPRVFSRIAGLMTMAPEVAEAEEVRPVFRRLREMRDALEGQGLLPPGAGLSMGMSGDYGVAVEEGATVVRVGTAIFSGLRDLPGPAARETEG